MLRHFSDLHLYFTSKHCPFSYQHHKVRNGIQKEKVIRSCLAYISVQQGMYRPLASTATALPSC